MKEYLIDWRWDRPQLAWSNLPDVRIKEIRLRKGTEYPYEVMTEEEVVKVRKYFHDRCCRSIDLLLNEIAYFLTYLRGANGGLL